MNQPPKSYQFIIYSCEEKYARKSGRIGWRQQDLISNLIALKYKLLILMKPKI